MFDKDLQIRGIHATYWKHLVNTAKVFDRYIDVYMVAPVLGLLYGKTSKTNTEENSSDTAGMLAEILIKNQTKLKYIYRLIMLLDRTSNMTEEQRINRAFRDDSDSDAVSKNILLFNSYFLGGVELLYDAFNTGCTTEEDYINKIYEFVDNFKRDQEIDNIGIDIENLLYK